MSAPGGATQAPIRVERTGPGGAVARVMLARPERRNALDAAMIEALAEAFRSFRHESASALRVVVLAGDGPTFCAGADVAWMRAAMALAPAENIADALRLAEMYSLIDACPVPVVARVQGAALGGGAGLCVVGDVVVAEAAARLGFPEVRLGLLPATISPFVVRRLGEGSARRLFVTGERIDAREAQRVGLVDVVAEGEGALDEAVEAVVAAVLAGAPEAVRASKALVREVVEATGIGAADQSATRTAELLAERRASAEASEGFAAFEQRRRPAWTPPEDPG